MHFGRQSLADERAHETALIECLRSYEEEIDGLYLLGDVFDQYIEYRNLVPKGFVRFQSLLAEWTDRGIPITYVTGNHDPWHLDYFESELGVRVVTQELADTIDGMHIYMNHGDIVASRFPMYSLIKRLLQHPLPVALYRGLLPGDIGFRLARWVNRRIHTDVINEDVIRRLREHARQLLENKPYNAVIMGHSHHAELVENPAGTYVNTGCWRLHRTYAILRSGSFELLKWEESLESGALGVL